MKMNKLIELAVTIVKTNDLAYKGFYSEIVASKSGRVSSVSKKSSLINHN